MESSGFHGWNLVDFMVKSSRFYARNPPDFMVESGGFHGSEIWWISWWKPTDFM